jgi:serine/threonine-protein kinase
MERARWERIQGLFHAAADRPLTEQRRFLEVACGGDDGLLADVLALLDEDARGTPSPLEHGVADVAMRVLSTTPPIASSQLGPYRLKGVLGEGGMGVVYLAERTDLGSLVAIKLLSDALLSPARRERFAAEQRMLAKLDHPSIARLYDAGALDDGTPFFVMEYVDGKPLTEHCREKRTGLLERLRLFRALCEAVQFAHRHAIIHRDIKPSNVLVRRDGSVRLLDFGIAKHLEHLEPSTAAEKHRTETGMRMLTPAYAAPEQIQGDRVGIFSDVYSLGVVLYELLAGRLPTDRSRGRSAIADGEDRPAKEPDKPSAAARSPGEDAVSARPGAWADLDVLVLTAMHGEPQRRYGSVEALIRDIDHFLAGEPLEARPDSVGYRLRKFVTRHRRSVVAAGLGAVSIVSLVSFFIWRLTVERNYAKRQTAIAAHINQFLSSDLLEQSDPFQSGKSTETLLAAIERALPDIDRRFHDEPEVAARLHHTIARSLDARSDYALARDQYERAATLFNRVGGPRSEDAVLVRLQCANMEARSYAAGSLPRAREILAQQEAMIQTLDHPPAEIGIWRLAAKGMIAAIANEPKETIANYQAAISAAQHLSDFDPAVLQGFKERLLWGYVRAGQGPEAERVARELISETTKASGPTHSGVLRLRLKLAQALLIQNKHAEAIEEADALYPLISAALGPDHEVALQVLLTRANSEGTLERWEDSIRDDLEAHRIAMKKDGPLTFLALAPLSDAGLSECRAGRLAQGEAHSREAFDGSRTAFGDRAGMTGGAAYSLATCLVGLGRVDEASALFGNIDVRAVEQMAPASDWKADIALGQAEIALLRGDLGTARRLIDAAEPAYARPDADQYQKRKVGALRAALEAKSKATGEGSAERVGVGAPSGSGSGSGFGFGSATPPR